LEIHARTTHRTCSDREATPVEGDWTRVTYEATIKGAGCIERKSELGEPDCPLRKDEANFLKKGRTITGGNREVEKTVGSTSRNKLLS